MQFAARRRFEPPLGRSVGQKLLRHVLKVFDEPAGVDCNPERAAIREAVNHVAPSQLDRIETEAARGAVDKPLDQIIGLGLAVAAIGIDRHRISEDTADRHEDGRDRVDSAHRARR
ncbi:MAG: hypothetical protein WA184_13320 [Stellaceae bacterium]